MDLDTDKDVNDVVSDGTPPETIDYNDDDLGGHEPIEPDAQPTKKPVDDGTVPTKHEVDKALQQQQQLRANAERDASNAKAELAEARRELSEAQKVKDDALESLDSEHDDPVEQVKVLTEHVKVLTRKADQAEKDQSDAQIRAQVDTVTRDIEGYKAKIQKTYGKQFANDATEIARQEAADMGYDLVDTFPTVAEAKAMYKSAYLQAVHGGQKPGQAIKREPPPRQVTATRNAGSTTKEPADFHGNPDDVRADMMRNIQGRSGRYNN